MCAGREDLPKKEDQPTSEDIGQAKPEPTDPPKVFPVKYDDIPI